MTFSSVILAGGKSSRMGEDKARLMLEGQRFIDRLYAELSALGECVVSVDSADRRPELSRFRLVEDIYPDCGPLSGLHAALKSAEGDAVLAVSCDMPLFRRELGRYLISCLGESDALVPVTAEGRKNPLCAVYTKKCAAAFERGLLGGSFSVMSALDSINVKYISLSEFHSEQLRNINTPQDYEALLREGSGEV